MKNAIKAESDYKTMIRIIRNIQSMLYDQVIILFIISLHFNYFNHMKNRTKRCMTEHSYTSSFSIKRER